MQNLILNAIHNAPFHQFSNDPRLRRLNLLVEQAELADNLLFALALKISSSGPMANKREQAARLHDRAYKRWQRRYAAYQAAFREQYGPRS